MTPDDRTRAIALAITNLEWLTDGYRTYQQALTILADTRTTATIAAGSTSGDGRHAVGSHSDPTGRSAVGTLADNDHQTDTIHERAQRMARRLQRDVNWIAETAAEIHTATLRALHDIEPPSKPYTLEQALAHTRTAGAPPRQTEQLFTGHQPMRASIAATTLRQLDRFPEAALLDDHIVELARATTRLRSTVTRILYRATKPLDPPKPKQKPRLVCVDCVRHGIESDVAEGSKKRCPKCLRFRKEYPGVAPTATMVRSWADGRERLTPGMIAEAVAASPAARKAHAS